MSPVTAGNSYWMESMPSAPRPALSGDIATDVCIIGGGITGLLCAFELAEAGLHVVVLESKQIASNVTGFTTAKVTSQHGSIYQRLTESLGAGVARTYGRANQKALERIRQIVTDLHLAADFEPRDAYVYGTHPDSVEHLKAEAQAAADAGLPAGFTTEVPVPFRTVGAVRFTDQAQVHPRRLLVPLAEALSARGVQIFGSSRATSVERNGRYVVGTREGTVAADSVVVAALTPVAGVGNDLWDYLYCHQGFAVAMPLRGDGPGGVLISYERPMRSMRTIKHGSKRLLEVGGGSYVEDPNSGASPYDDLEDWARRNFDVDAAQYRWTTQDYSTFDGVPLIGALEDGLHIATGFGGWGMTTAGVAAAIISDRILDRSPDEERDRIFDPRRPLGTVDPSLISARTSSGTNEDARDRVRNLSAGQAAVVRHQEEQLAMFRNRDGELDVVSAVCTHAGGIVLWDLGNTQWSCPCHGSVFQPDGSVVQGPAKDPLPNRSDLFES